MPPIDRQAVFLPNGAIKLEGATEEPLKVGDRAPDFTLTGTDGEYVSLSDFEGKTVLLTLAGRLQNPVRQEHVKSLAEFARTLPAGRVVPLVVAGTAQTFNEEVARSIEEPDLMILDDSANDIVIDTYRAPDASATLVVIDPTGVISHIATTSFDEEKMFAPKRRDEITRALSAAV